MERIQRQQIVSSVVRPTTSSMLEESHVSQLPDKGTTGLFSPTKTPNRGIFTAQARETPSDVLPSNESKRLMTFLPISVSNVLFST